MSIYVDEIAFYPHTKLRYKYWCHMATDSNDIEELHKFAEMIGLQRSWYQPYSHPHYDLTPNKRQLAISKGAIAVDSIEFVRKCVIDRFKNRSNQQ